VLLLFIGSWLLRRDLPEQPETAALVLSFAGAGISLITSWLGGSWSTGWAWGWTTART
jgi:hypothetical protein